jgi:hypothetical protein
MSPPHTPVKPKRQEHDTPHRACFFHAYFHKQKCTRLGAICRRKVINIPLSTARTWLHNYEIKGSPTIRRTRKTSTRLGRPKSIDVK